jgi:hypothetical protein
MSSPEAREVFNPLMRMVVSGEQEEGRRKRRGEKQQEGSEIFLSILRSVNEIQIDSTC